MFRAFALTMAVIGVSTLNPDCGAVALAQSHCSDCDLPPSCRDSADSSFSVAKGRNCQRLELSIESNIDFGRVVVLGEGEGRVLLDLDTGQKRLIGDVDDLGGVPVTGRAIITGAPFEPVVIELPNEVAMRDPTGGNARIRDFVSDLPGFPTLDANGQLEFRFTGTLVIEANTQASGNLRGRIPITVEYP